MEFLTGTGLLAGASRRGIEEQEVNLLRSRPVFDAGEGLSEHTAPYDALVLGVDGEAEISIGASPTAWRWVNFSRFRLASPMRSRRRRRSRCFWS